MAHRPVDPQNSVQPGWIGIEPPGLSADIKDTQRPMVTPHPPAHDMHDRHVSDIRQRIGRGEYRVDTQAVAEAILRRLRRDDELFDPGRGPQEPCS